ncbi:hypothetical protein NNO_0925 [Hydrogenimonas sp.]|nr:hypothetical protein NNO_0925 [Hydrogenimonas sp.]
MRERLEAEAARRNDPAELSFERPDPLLVARELDDDRAVLLCAMFGYGNAVKIVDFLRSLDFSLLDAGEAEIERALSGSYYRFQSTEDVVEIFKTLGRVEPGRLEAEFMEGYRENGRVIEGVFRLISLFYTLNSYDSRGYRFLTGSVPKSMRPSGPYKRWMMFLRWMVRKDALDLGLWEGVKRSDLVIPLDTHTFQVGRELGLLKRKTYDWRAAVELTEALKRFSPEDPVKYDFALYRIGQERLLDGGS